LRSLVRVLGDFAVAEKVVQDCLLTAWQRWQADGIPDNPAGWLWTTARRRASMCQAECDLPGQAGVAGRRP
jgi:predicted RNA polymerase sigma factor